MENRCLFGNAKTINKPHCKRRKEVCFIYKDIRTKRPNKTIAEYKASEYMRRKIRCCSPKTVNPIPAADSLTSN